MTVTYKFEQSSGLFEDLNALLIAISGVAISAELTLSGNATFNPSDYLTLEGKHLDVKVRLPLFGPIPTALIGTRPDFIEVTVVTGKEKEKSYTHTTNGFIATIHAIFQPFFVNYYERHIEEIKMTHGNFDKVWPLPWQMGRVIRNGISHGGCVYFRSPKHQSVLWQGLTLSPSDNGEQLLGNLISVGDLTVLLIEMELARAGAVDM